MHAPSHRESFQPAGSLLDPGDDTAIRLFVGGGVDDLGRPAAAGQTDAQIRVLGDVPRVPGVGIVQRGAPEKAGGPAQGHQQPHPRNPRQQNPKPRRIFDGKAARQPVGAGVVEIQRALQATDPRIREMEMPGDAVQLIGVGSVLGVPDADDAAAAEVQRIVQRAGLGLDRPVGNLDHAHPCGQFRAFQRILGDMVAGLDRQQDVGQFARIGQPRQPRDKLARDIAFLKQRHDDRNHRQGAIHLRRRNLCGGQIASGAGLGPVMQHGIGKGQQLQRALPDQSQRHDGGQPAQQRRRHEPDRDQRQQDDGDGQSAHHRFIPRATAFSCGHAGFGLTDQGGATSRKDRALRLRFGAKQHSHGAEFDRHPGDERGEFLGAGGGDPGDAADAAPGQNRMRQAEIGSGKVDQARVTGRCRRIDGRTAPLTRQRAGQGLWRSPALGQKDLTQTRLLPTAQHLRFQQMRGIDDPVLQKDLAQWLWIARCKRRTGLPRDRRGGRGEQV